MGGKLKYSDLYHEKFRRTLSKMFAKLRGMYRIELSQFVLQKNLYGDVVESELQQKILLDGYMELDPPKATAKGFGWYTDGSVMPIILYVSVYAVGGAEVIPERGNIVDVTNNQFNGALAIQKGKYRVIDVKVVGQAKPYAWVLNLETVKE